MKWNKKSLDSSTQSITTTIIIVLGLIFFSFQFPLKRSYIQIQSGLNDNTINYVDHKFHSLNEGDVIFQISKSEQSKAIQLATKSQYSHCGIIFKKGVHYFVYEAVQPVKTTPLEKWIQQGELGHFVVKRLKNADSLLTTETIQKMKNEGNKYLGKNYDKAFEWSDEKMYCSELVWKIYFRSLGLELGNLQKLEDFDLTSEIVKKTIKERYGENIPYIETVISPASIFNCELLYTIRTEN